MAQRLDLLGRRSAGESQRGIAGNQADKSENDQAGEKSTGTAWMSRAPTYANTALTETDHPPSSSAA